MDNGDIHSWAAEEFVEVNLGDKRLNQKLIQLCDRFSEAPESPIRPFSKSLFVYSECVLHTDFRVSGDFISERIEPMSLSVRTSASLVRNPAR